MDYRIISLAAVVIMSYTVEAMAGFGSTILAVAICAHFLPLEFLVPVLLLVNLVLSSYVVIRHRKHIAKKYLFQRVLPIVGLGAFLGSYLFKNLSGESGKIKFIFGIFITILSLFELIQIIKTSHHTNQKKLKGYQSFLWLLGGGLMQGMYASGGPMIVYQLSRQGLSKQTFRATLSSLWLSVNTFLVLNYIISGILSSDIFKTGILLIPSVIIGIISGEKLHNWINERYFKIFIYFMLIVVGILLIV